MKKKGFTLIELLAVIVVLAIIALIATPIVMNVISGVQKSAAEQSVEFYLKAVEQAVIRQKTDDVTFNPTNCYTENDSLVCDTSNTELLVDISGEKPNYVNITLNNGEVTNGVLSFNNGIYCITKGTNGKNITVTEDIARCGINKLDTPTISIEGDTLTIIDNSNKATSFNILVNGELKTTTINTIFDLSSLGLSKGTYSVVVKSLANGYIDSTESNPLSYTVDSNSDITGTTVKGVWVINYNAVITETIEQTVFFISNGKSYSSMKLQHSKFVSDLYYDDDCIGNAAFEGIIDTWLDGNDEYQTVDFGETEQEVSDKFYTWLTANATQQTT